MIWNVAIDGAVACKIFCKRTACPLVSHLNAHSWS
jgi:hypothetical protein